MKITITRTIQIRQYEPLTVTVEQEQPVNSNEDYQKLRDTAIACVVDTILEAKEKMKENR